MKAGFFSLPRLSFSGKVLFCVLGLLVLSTVTMNLFYLHSQQENFTRTIDKDGRLLADVLASNVRLGIFANDARQLEQSLDTVFALDAVVGACVYSSGGELLGRKARPGWDSTSVCEKPLPLTDLVVLTGNEQKILRLEALRTINFWSPVIAGPSQFTEDALYFGGGKGGRPLVQRNIGFVGVVFDKGLIQENIRAILGDNLFILFLFLIFGFLAAFYIIQAVSRPLNRLVATIRSHEHGQGARDEVGMLADTFSGMVQTIGDSFTTINELKQGLEQKVDELEIEIGRRESTEAALRESEEKYRSISENIADGVAIIVDGDLAWYNEAFRAIFGEGKDGRPDVEVVRLVPAADGTWLSLSGDGAERYRLEVGKKDGLERIIEVHAQKIFYEGRDGVQLIIRDISKSEQMEQERKELEVKALGQSKLASLGKIATSVAHEVNQPLSFIKIAYESLLRDMRDQRLDPEEMEISCQEALRQVDRITVITNHLRSFGRADTSLFSEISLREILDNSLTLMRESLRLADITLEVDIAADLPFVTGNSVTLEQVFINLFQNSVDAMAGRPEKKIMVAMRKAGPGIEICFADSGPGIPPDVREHIFEPFFTTKRLEDRSGLGLGIVNNIIREHKGTIEYREREGWGASFLITLPVSG